MYWKVKHWRFLEWVRPENLKSLSIGSSLKFEAERLVVMYFLYLTDSPCHTSLQGQIELVPMGPYKYQSAVSTLQLQRAGHQPEHDNILWLRRERLHHWGKLFAKGLPARFYWSARFAIESFLTVKIYSCLLYMCRWKVSRMLWWWSSGASYPTLWRSQATEIPIPIAIAHRAHMFQCKNLTLEEEL